MYQYLKRRLQESRNWSLRSSVNFKLLIVCTTFNLSPWTTMCADGNCISSVRYADSTMSHIIPCDSLQLPVIIFFCLFFHSDMCGLGVFSILLLSVLTCMLIHQVFPSMCCMQGGWWTRNELFQLLLNLFRASPHLTSTHPFQRVGQKRTFPVFF